MVLLLLAGCCWLLAAGRVGLLELHGDVGLLKKLLLLLFLLLLLLLSSWLLLLAGCWLLAAGWREGWMGGGGDGRGRGWMDKLNGGDLVNNCPTPVVKEDVTPA